MVLFVLYNMKHTIQFPCWSGELYLMETNKFFDYSTRTEVAAGKHIFKVTNVGVDIDETGDMNSEVRLYYCPDGKNIHDSHVVMMFEVFERELAEGTIEPYDE